MSPNSLRQELEKKYATRMIYQPEWASLVSYVGNRNFPVLRLFRYKEAFSFDLVYHLLRAFKADPRRHVLFDPFCGMGTTNFSGHLLGFRTIGLDRLPLAVFSARCLISLLELNDSELSELQRLFEALKAEVEKGPAFPVADDVPIVKKAFREDILEEYRRWKGVLWQNGLPKKNRNILQWLLISTVEECSFTSKDGQFLRLKPDKPVVSPGKVLEKRLKALIEDLERLSSFKKKEGKSFIIEGDVRDTRIEERFPCKPHVLITSPPYANRYDYSRSYALELSLFFVNSARELIDLRHSLLRSHIESKVAREEKPPHPALEEVLSALRAKKLNNAKIPDLLLGYFIDMKKAISNWYRWLAEEAVVTMVVDNVRFEGEMIPVDLILSDMAEEIGFKVKKILVARYKGNSSQQMARYGKVPVRESIVIWQKKI